MVSKGNLLLKSNSNSNNNHAINYESNFKHKLDYFQNSAPNITSDNLLSFNIFLALQSTHTVPDNLDIVYLGL